MTAGTFIVAVLRGLKFRDLDYFRLLTRAILSRPRSPGRIRLRAGTIDYLDAEALFGQYEEIFAFKGYDFVTDSENPVVVDCGGNIGLSVIRLARRFPSARIEVYEADPRIAEVLRGNLSRNNIPARVVSAAVADADGEVCFNPDGNDGGTIIGASGGVRVAAVRLADALPPRVELLKLDIEGAEFSVLEDLCRSGAIARVQRIAGELHVDARSAGRVGRVLVELENAGFSVVAPFSRSAPDLSGEKWVAPFLRLPDARTLMHFYAWRPETT